MFKNLFRPRVNAVVPKELEAAVPEKKKTVDEVLHHIDYEDVAITAPAARLVKRAAQAMVDEYMPTMAGKKLSLGEAMAMFIDHMFWDERNGGLFLCTALGDKGLCLPIPKEMWAVKEHGTVVQ